MRKKGSRGRGVKRTSDGVENKTLNPGTPAYRQGGLNPRTLSMKLTHQEFEALVILALERLPKFFKKKMKNVDVVVEDRASGDLLSGMGLRSPFQLLGLYQGVPLDRRGFYYGNVLPDKIALFQIPIESICRTKEEIEEKVREVVIHEVGHYFGLSDERLRELERGEA
jgi:predicted Zn-dependent protease with MMP-like domain